MQAGGNSWDALCGSIGSGQHQRWNRVGGMRFCPLHAPGASPRRAITHEALDSTVQNSDATDGRSTHEV